MTIEETTHRGVRWQRDDRQHLRFYDADGGRWVTWKAGVDAPPLPPGWGGPSRAPGVERPPWRSPWRLVPLALVGVALVIAVVQALRPAGDAVGREANQTAALLGKCLAQHGEEGGHPKYASKPVPCDLPTAAVRVVRVIPTTPGSPLCPNATVGVELPGIAVRYPHVLCLQTLPSSARS